MRTEPTLEPAGSEVAILVVSCDAYQDLWPLFFHCFFKYWPDCPYPIYLGSNFLSYSDVRVSPILVGPDVDYTSNLLTMLNHIDQEWVILWIEDRMLSAPVSTPRVSKLIRLAQRNQAGYLKLITTDPLAFVDDETQEIGEIPKGVRYRSCMTVVLWNKCVLLKLLRPGETAWEFEHQGSQRSNALDDKFFCLSATVKKNPPLSNMHGVIKGRWTRDAIKFLKEHGFEHTLRGRSVETLRSYLYVKAYLLKADVYRKLRWYWRY